MTGQCTMCSIIIVGPEYAKAGADETERRWAEFTALREVQLSHMVMAHRDELAIIHAHAADYMKTLCTKFLDSAGEELAATRHDVSRLFYWVLMGDILMAKSRPHPPLTPNIGQS